MGVLFPRTSCVAPNQFYTCEASGFSGCCSVNACDFPKGCPDSGSSGQSSNVPTTSTIITVHSGTSASTVSMRLTSSSISAKASTSSQVGTSSHVGTSSSVPLGTLTSSTAKVSTLSNTSHSLTTSAVTGTSSKPGSLFTTSHSTTTTHTMTASNSSSSSTVTSHSPSATPSAMPQPSTHHTGIVVGSAFAGVFALLAIIVLARCCMRIKEGRRRVVERKVEEERVARENATFDRNNVF